MDKKFLINQSGGGLVEYLFWAVLLGLLAWAGWQLYLHPESFNSKPATHSNYEDTHQ